MGPSDSVVSMPARVPTFSAGVVITPAASPSDVFTIAGSATMTIFVKKIKVNGQTADTSLVQLIRRRTANTGGTSTNPTPVANDSDDQGNATATLTAYTANPSALGTAVGTMDAQYVTGAASSSSATDALPMMRDFGDILYDKPITLRGATDVLAVNLNGTSGITPIAVAVEWTEAGANG